MRINKSVVLNKMNECNIKTQAELAERLNINKTQLSSMLNGDFNPIKTNVFHMMKELDLSFEEITSEKDIISSNETHIKQLSLFDNDPELLNRFDYQLNEYVDISKVVNNKKYSSLEAFAGAGGLALGLEMAGFDNKGAIEIDRDAVKTLNHNRPDWNVYDGDINDLVNQKNKPENHFFENIKDIDVFTGGFPCQSFSYAGKRQGFADTRGTLFYPYSQLIDKIKPKMFIAENVKGLVNHDNGATLTTMIKIFKSIGYHVYWNVLNSWDYGVAQKRQRIFIVGIREDLIKKEKFSFKLPKAFEYKPVLKDALKNVPKSDGMAYSEKKYKVLDLVPAGGCWVDLPENIAKEYLGASWNSGGGKRGMARRISWDEPSLTLTTSPNQKQTERCHPDETRPFTVREYARIQSFPDNWEFKGNVGSQYKQIGNAVPVNLAKAVGLSAIKYLNQFNN